MLHHLLKLPAWPLDSKDSGPWIVRAMTMVRSDGENWFQFSWDITSQVIAHTDSQIHFNLLFALRPHKYREK